MNLAPVLSALNVAAAEQHHGGEANLVLPDLALGELPRHDRAGRCSRPASSCASRASRSASQSRRGSRRCRCTGRCSRSPSSSTRPARPTSLTQAKFIAVLWAFIAVIIAAYFGVFQQMGAGRVAIILAFSVVGILGSAGVAWFGIRVNTYANSRAAFASLARQALPDLRDPAPGRHVDRHDAHQRRAAPHALHPALRARTSSPAPASSASRSASRSAPRRSASPAASSRRSPTSAPTS